MKTTLAPNNRRSQLEMLSDRRSNLNLGSHRGPSARVGAPTQAADGAEAAEHTSAPLPSREIIRIYLREIGQLKLLTRAEEIDLARRVRRGDDLARERMILSNLRLVVKIAGDFSDLGVPLLDLINEGNIGLMKAVERFDPDNGAKFSSYAAWWIKQYIRRAISNQSRTIRLPVYIQDKLYRVNRAEARLTEQLGRTPTDEELGAELSMTPSRLVRLRAASRHTCALDAPMQSDADEGTFKDLVPDDQANPPDRALLARASRELLAGFLKELTPRELAVLKRRYGLGDSREMTLEEVGKELGLTRERIRQIQVTALSKLNHRFREAEGLC